MVSDVDQCQSKNYDMLVLWVQEEPSRLQARCSRSRQRKASLVSNNQRQRRCLQAPFPSIEELSCDSLAPHPWCGRNHLAMKALCLVRGGVSPSHGLARPMSNHGSLAIICFLHSATLLGPGWHWLFCYCCGLVSVFQGTPLLGLRFSSWWCHSISSTITLQEFPEILSLDVLWKVQWSTSEGRLPCLVPILFAWPSDGGWHRSRRSHERWWWCALVKAFLASMLFRWKLKLAINCCLPDLCLCLVFWIVYNFFRKGSDFIKI